MCILSFLKDREDLGATPFVSQNIDTFISSRKKLHEAIILLLGAYDLFPGKVIAAKMPIAGGVPIDRSSQIKLLQNSCH